MIYIDPPEPLPAEEFYTGGDVPHEDKSPDKSKVSA
jgi:hypothetical protein